MRARALCLAVLGLLGCSDARIEPKPVQLNNVDNRLTLSGRVCTDPPDMNGFPVKVVLIVDQSGSIASRIRRVRRRRRASARPPPRCCR